jgi:hypothetical protein
MMTSLTSNLNAGFLRLQSFLAVIIVSDGDDFSGYGRATDAGFDHNYSAGTLDSVASYVTALDNLTGSTASNRRYNVSNISSLDVSCPTEGPQQYPSRQMQLSSMTDGLSGSICDASFANTLNSIQGKISELSTQFHLDRIPDVSTIVVKVNGMLIPNNASNGWIYVSSSNSIVFKGSAIPTQGANIQVNYTPMTIQ